MGFLRKFGIVSAVAAGTLASLTYKPKFVPTPPPVISYSYKWNPNHHQIMLDTFEISKAKEDVKEKDLLVAAVKGYFLSNAFQPQIFLMRRFRDNSSTKKELWDIEHLKREELQPGSYLYDHFEILEVEPSRVWLKFAMGVVMLEVEENNNDKEDVLVRMSSVIWDEKEDKVPAPTPAFYAHLCYQRLLLQSGIKKM